MDVNSKKLVSELLSQNFKTEFADQPEKAIANAIEKSTEHPLSTDVWIYRIVVSVLGASLLIMVVFLSIQLGVKKVEIPDVFISIISAIVGAITGLLAPSPFKNETK